VSTFNLKVLTAGVQSSRPVDANVLKAAATANAPTAESWITYGQTPLEELRSWHEHVAQPALGNLRPLQGRQKVRGNQRIPETP
jgi:hypothetical protein